MDGRLVPWGEATVHLLSHSLQRGSLIFDYMSVHETPRGPAVFRLREHVVRFQRSAEILGLPLERSVAELEAAVCETVRANPGASAVKICAYFPSVEIDVVPQSPRLALAVAAYDPRGDIAARMENPPPLRPVLKLWIERERRNRRHDIVPPQAKVAANYLGPMLAKWAARKAGYDEIVLVDEEGFLAEGPTTNLFLVDAKGTLRTPREDRVLLGITRRTILDLAKHDGRPAEEAALRPDDLLGASEAFLTATTAGVWPVISVDGITLGDGTPGPVTRALAQRFEAVSSGRDPAFEHWLAYVEG